MKKKFIIIGGGIAGLTTAIALQKAGFVPYIYEASPKAKGIGAGLVLAANAMKALRSIGIADAVIQKGHSLARFTIEDEQGKIISFTDSFKSSSQYGVDNFTIHRADLHEVLLSYIPENQIFLNKKVLSFEQDAKGVKVFFADGTSVEGDYLLAADGIHSPIRLQVLPKSLPRYSGYTCWRGITDAMEIEKMESSETWGIKGRFGLVPLTNKRIYWFACINAPEKSEIHQKYTKNDLIENFKNYHSPIPQVLANTQEFEIILRDIVDFEPIKKFAFQRVLLIGDAAHATTPNMGQGACQAIEDAAVLGKLLSANNEIEKVFLTFEKVRIARTTFIVNQSYQIGKVAQLSSPFLAKIRNFVFRLIPASFNQKLLNKVLDVEF